MTPRSTHRAEQVSHLELMPGVEVGRRLVQQQHLGLLSERRGNEDRLTLTTRQGVHRSLTQFFQTNCGKGSTDAVEVVGARSHLPG